MCVKWNNQDTYSNCRGICICVSETESARCSRVWWLWDSRSLHYDPIDKKRSHDQKGEKRCTIFCKSPETIERRSLVPSSRVTQHTTNLPEPHCHPSNWPQKSRLDSPTRAAQKQKQTWFEWLSCEQSALPDLLCCLLLSEWARDSTETKRALLAFAANPRISCNENERARGASRSTTCARYESQFFLLVKLNPYEGWKANSYSLPLETVWNGKQMTKRKLFRETRAMLFLFSPIFCCHNSTKWFIAATIAAIVYCVQSEVQQIKTANRFAWNWSRECVRAWNASVLAQ